MMKTYQSDGKAPYPIYSAEVGRFQELPALSYPSKYFVLFLIADFEIVSCEEITEIAKQLIDRGLAHICLWGPSCEKAHTAFDLANIAWEEANGRKFPVYSDAYHNEPIEDALWSAIYCASVDDPIWEQATTICVTVANQEWKNFIEHNLSELNSFNERMTNA